MTSLERSRVAALGAVAGPLLFTLAWLILGLLSPGFSLFGIRFEPYSPVSHPVSGLGLGATAPFMNAAFVVTGALVVIGVVGVFRQIPGIGARARWTCIVLLGLSGVGAIVAGIFTLESMALHSVGFGLGCGLPIVSFLVAGLVLRRVPGWRRLGRWLVVASPVTLALFVLSMATFDHAAAVAGTGVAGLTQRVLIVETQLGFVALGWAGFRRAAAPGAAGLARAASVAALVVATSACTPPFRDCESVEPELLAALPARLSGTGLDADGVMSFAPRFELWSDGATKRRWLYLPPGTQIDTSDPDAWNFPVGTKLWKELARDGARIETRLLYKHGAEPGAWTPVAYVWGGDGDAWATPEGATDARGTPHDVPDAAACMGCHGGTPSGVLGVSAVQLPERALGELSDAGVLTAAVTPTEIPGDDATRAALGYLHANCGHCHNQRRPVRDGARCFDPERAFDLSLRTDELETPAATATYRTAIGVVITPGDPAGSDVVRRARSRDRWWGMPPLGTEVVDHDGVRVVVDWIRRL